MWLLPQNKDQIAWLSGMQLISLSLECNNMIRRCTGWHKHLQLSALFDNVSTLTSLALPSFPENITHPLAIATFLLHLSVHSGSNLSHLDHSTLSFAFRAFSHVFATLALASLADSSPLVMKRNLPAFVKLLKSDLEGSFGRLHLRLFFRFFVTSTLLCFHHAHELYMTY